jgi:uncharacterized cupin superfamily protein
MGIVVQKYSSIKQALGAIIGEDKNYILLKHILLPGEEIELHYHKKANEWIIIDKGKFQVRLEREERDFDIQDETIVIHFPAQQKHSFLPKSKISYFVIRDREDKTIYCEKI